MINIKTQLIESTFGKVLKKKARKQYILKYKIAIKRKDWFFVSITGPYVQKVGKETSKITGQEKGEVVW